MTPPFEVRLRHRDGSWRHFKIVANNLLHDPAVGGIVLNARDITERKALEARLEHQATHDALTGLPNRALFLDQIARAAASAARHGETLTILFLDLDGFKAINDRLGHAAGDMVLVTAAQRLRECVRTTDTVARLGGDEFTILLERVADRGAVLRIAERIIAALAAPLVFGRDEARVSASVGIVFSAGGRDAPDTIVRRADEAMYRAKRRGKGRYEVFGGASGEVAAARAD